MAWQKKQLMKNKKLEQQLALDDQNVELLQKQIGDDYIKARLPVDERTKQPFGLLHGGISCFLAE